jgi:hypothetical protein
MEDLSNPKQVSRKRKNAKKYQDKLTMAIKHIMGNQDGRLFMHNFLTLTHMFHTSFDRDAFITAYREGERNIGLQYFAILMNECLPEYIIMMKENQDDNGQSTDDAENDSAHGSASDDTAD